jgi:hypothetical protein
MQRNKQAVLETIAHDCEEAGQISVGQPSKPGAPVRAEELLEASLMGVKGQGKSLPVKPQRQSAGTGLPRP